MERTRCLREWESLSPNNFHKNLEAEMREELCQMIMRSLPNISRTFFLIYDNTESQMRPLFVWASSRADAIDTIMSYNKWRAGRS